MNPKLDGGERVRVWTVETDEYAEGKRDWMVGKQEPPVEKPERVLVVEAEPVTEVLERVKARFRYVTIGIHLERDIEALLQTLRAKDPP